MPRSAVGFVLLSALLLASFRPAAAQQKARTMTSQAAAACQAELDQLKVEVDRLKTENADLQKKLNELLMQQLDAARQQKGKATEAEDAALAAVRAVSSVVDAASFQDFKKYLLDAKVKVESLPAGPNREALAELVLGFRTIEALWTRKMKSDREDMYRDFVFPSDIESIRKLFPDVEKDVPSSPTRMMMKSRGDRYFKMEDMLGYTVSTMKKRIDSFALSGR